MKDIFDSKIFCKDCNIQMKPLIIEKKGFRLRAVKCPKCNEKIIHPTDISNFNHYNNLKQKTYNVKLRVVGNSHAISIPKEIVDFINDSHLRMRKHFNDIVKLCFEDFGKLSLNFIDEGEIKQKW